MILTVIEFKCCGSEVTTTGRGTGIHEEYCLSCDTANPETEVRTEEA